MPGTVKQENYIRANSFWSSDKQRQWDYNTICANTPGWKTFWQKFFRLRAQVQKRKGERENTRKDVENNDNSRSFAYYRSSPIPTLWAEEHISTITEEDNIHMHDEEQRQENSVWQTHVFSFTFFLRNFTTS